jgi:hypothetical protein
MWNDIPKTASEGYKQIADRPKKMKASRSPATQSVLVLAGICCLFFTATAPMPAAPEDQIDNALSQDKWVLVLKTIRNAWGKVVNRNQISHIYKPNGYDGLEGECMVITYDTTFAKLDSAMEVVVLKWEDGKWLGAGYNAGPKPVADDGSQAPPAAPTETHTEPHATPQPQ